MGADASFLTRSAQTSRLAKIANISQVTIEYQYITHSQRPLSNDSAVNANADFNQTITV